MGESAEDIARDIVNGLIDDITSDVVADDMKEQKEQKDETILTEHIRSVKSTKKILGLNTMTTELPKEELVQIIDEVKEIIADKDKDKDKDKVDKDKEDK